MANPVVDKGDGELTLTPDTSDGRAVMKAKINTIWEELKTKESLPPKVGSIKVKKVVKPCERDVPSWMANLGLAPPRSVGQVRPKVVNGDASDGRPKAFQCSVFSGRHQVKAKENLKSSEIDLSINEVLTKGNEGADSTSKASGGSKDLKAAHALRRKSEMQASSSSGLDDLLHQLGKKQKPNILETSRTDWGQFKQEKGLEDELEAYKRSGDKYLDKVAFLQRSDVREYEKERDTRLALQSKRQFETAPSS